MRAPRGRPESRTAGIPRPSTADIASTIARDGLPVVGVFFLGWEAVPVVFIFLLDALLCLWSIAPAAIRSMETEDPAMFAAFSGMRLATARAVWRIFIAVVWSLLVAVPGGFILGRLAETSPHSLADMLTGRTVLAAAGVMALTYAIQAVWTYRGIHRPDVRLQARIKGTIVVYRTVLAGAFSFAIVGSWTLKFFTLFLCGLSAAFELNPWIFARMLGEGPGREAGAGEGTPPGTG